ncbi:AcvB/VirJ family lysyl-phosphatidylglycerol hydrolase [Sphingobium sp. CR28]|uniref:AcvB/VirJ family lysyl-phosphatidylglycerol hydrolase n=1 Tax=Sphingobium sp. CR28 TaxID=3400272 RepID=UPI003FEF89B5
MVRIGRTLRRWRSFAAGLFIAALIGVGLCGGHLGYPWGSIYKMVPSTVGNPRLKGTVAVFFSGDMGLNTGMGPKIAAHLAAQGMPVLGVNSLTAFSSRLSPEQTEKLVSQAIDRALAIPGAQRVLVIGQSFGADALVAGLPSLPQEDQARIALVALVVPADTLSYRATPGGIFNWGNDGPSLPHARRLVWAPTLCVHGETEAHSLCPIWNQPNVTRVTLPGDHFLNRNSALVADTIMQAYVSPDGSMIRAR